MTSCLIRPLSSALDATCWHGLGLTADSRQPVVQDPQGLKKPYTLLEQGVPPSAAGRQLPGFLGLEERR